MTIDEAWRELWAEIENHGYASLTADQLLWLDTRAVIDATNNGGIISYFYNSGANRYYECLIALEQLKAAAPKQLLQQAGALFGDSVSSDQAVRNAIIRTWEDRQDAKLDRLLARLDEQLYGEFPALEARLLEFLKDSGISG